MKFSESHPMFSSSTKKCKIGDGLFSFMVAGIVIALNIPGQLVQTLDLYSVSIVGVDFQFVDHLAYGWPFTFFISPTSCQGFFRQHYSPLDGWSNIGGGAEFNIWWFAVNVIVDLVVVAGVVFCFQHWRSRRKSLLQLRLRDLFVITGSVAVVLGIFVALNSRYERELAIVDQTASAESVRINEQHVFWARSGPLALQMLAGANADYVSGIDVARKDLGKVAQLRHVELLRIFGTISKAHLKTLELCDQLKALVIYGKNPDIDYDQKLDNHLSAEEDEIILPNLPRLRGLNLQNSNFLGKGLKNLKSLEVLKLSQTQIDDSLIPTLTKLRKLKLLQIQETKISVAGVEKLRHDLPNCLVISDYTTKVETAP